MLACGFLADVVARGPRRGRRGRPAADATSKSPSPAAPPVRSSSPRSTCDDRFLALNGDVLTDLDLTALMRLHEGAGALGDPRPLPRRRRQRLRPRRAISPAVRSPSSSRSPTPPGSTRTRSTPATYVLEREVLDLRFPPDSQRSRSSATCSHAWSATASTVSARGLLDGHRNARALPAGDLGHPRGPGRDRCSGRPRPTASLSSPRLEVDARRLSRAAPAPSSAPAVGSAPARVVSTLRAPRWLRRSARGAPSRARSSAERVRSPREATVRQDSVIGRGDDGQR